MQHELDEGNTLYMMLGSSRKRTDDIFSGYISGLNPGFSCDQMFRWNRRCGAGRFHILCQQHNNKDRRSKLNLQLFDGFIT